MLFNISTFLYLGCSNGSAFSEQQALQSAQNPTESTATSNKDTVSKQVLPPGSNKEENTVGYQKLPDMLKGLSKKGCDNGPGVHGAASYFYTELKINGSKVEGTEKWILYANKKWKEKGGKDCSVLWTVSGSTGSAAGCGACDLGVTMTNALDKSASNCPKKMANTNTGETIRYNLQRKPDGTVVVYYPSGKKYAEGYHAGNKIVVRSDLSCRWF